MFGTQLTSLLYRILKSLINTQFDISSNKADTHVIHIEFNNIIILLLYYHMGCWVNKLELMNLRW